MSKRSNFADFLRRRNFDTDAILRLCHFRKISSFNIVANAGVFVYLYYLQGDTLEQNPLFTGFEKSRLLRDVQKRYLRAYLKFTPTDECNFSQFNVLISVECKGKQFQFQKNDYSQNLKIGGSHLLVYDLLLQRGKAPMFLRNLPIVDDLLH